MKIRKFKMQEKNNIGFFEWGAMILVTFFVSFIIFFEVPEDNDQVLGLIVIFWGLIMGLPTLVITLTYSSVKGRLVSLLFSVLMLYWVASFGDSQPEDWHIVAELPLLKTFGLSKLEYINGDQTRKLGWVVYVSCLVAREVFLMVRIMIDLRSHDSGSKYYFDQWEKSRVDLFMHQLVTLSSTLYFLSTDESQIKIILCFLMIVCIHIRLRLEDEDQKK